MFFYTTVIDRSMSFSRTMLSSLPVSIDVLRLKKYNTHHLIYYFFMRPLTLGRIEHIFFAATCFLVIIEVVLSAGGKTKNKITRILSHAYSCTKLRCYTQVYIYTVLASVNNLIKVLKNNDTFFVY